MMPQMVGGLVLRRGNLQIYFDGKSIPLVPSRRSGHGKYSLDAIRGLNKGTLLPRLTPATRSHTCHSRVPRTSYWLPGPYRRHPVPSSRRLGGWDNSLTFDSPYEQLAAMFAFSIVAQEFCKVRRGYLPQPPSKRAPSPSVLREERP